MTRGDSVKPTEDDPVTVVALIYRIVDQPRRGFICAVLLLPILAAAVQVAAPAAKLLGLPASALLWSGTGIAGCGWVLRAVIHWFQRRADRRLVSEKSSTE